MMIDFGDGERGRANRLPSASRDTWRDPYGKSLLVRLKRVLPRSAKLVDVAKRSGFHPETVRRYLNGQSTMPADFVAAVCLAYRLDVAWVLGIVEAPEVRVPLTQRRRRQLSREIGDAVVMALLDPVLEDEEAADSSDGDVPIVPTNAAPAGMVVVSRLPSSDLASARGCVRNGSGY